MLGCGVGAFLPSTQSLWAPSQRLCFCSTSTEHFARGAVEHSGALSNVQQWRPVWRLATTSMQGDHDEGESRRR